MEEFIVERRLIRTYFSKKPTGPATFVSLFVLLICVIVSQVYWQNNNYSSLLAANADLTFNKGEYWRFFTTTFIHGDMGHLLSNAYMLGILGFFVYTYFGSSIYPLTSSILAALVNALTLRTYEPHVFLIGASGLVYLLAGFWLTMYIFIERQRSLKRRIVIALGVALIILFPSSFEERVSYSAHAYGLVLGIIFGNIYFLTFKNKIRKSEKWRTIIDSPLDESQE